MNELIYSNEYVEVFYKNASSSDVIVTFSHMTNLANGKTFWGEQVLRDRAAIGIMPKKAEWYFGISNDCIAIINDITKNYLFRIGYGFSMGAYGAIKFSKTLNLDLVVALSPQYSIDPEDVGHFDKRYAHHFKEKLKGHKIKQSDISGDLFIIVDDCFQLDIAHARYLKSLSTDNCHLLPVSYLKHSTMDAFKGKSKVEALFHALASKNLLAFHQISKKWKKKTQSYYYYLGGALLERKKFNLALKVFDKGLYIFPESSIFYSRIAQCYLKLLLLLSEALNFALKGIVLNGVKEDYYVYSEILIENDREYEAAKILLLLWSKTSHPEHLRRAIVILEKLKLYDEALSLINLGVSIHGETPALLSLSAKVNWQLKKTNEAFLSVDKLLSNSPNSYFLWMKLNMLIEDGARASALEEVQKYPQLIDDRIKKLLANKENK